MENPSIDVSGTSSPVVSEDLNPQNQPAEEPVVTPAPVETPTPGAQTPSENLLAALKEERARRKELEDKLNEITTTTPTEDFVSDEGKALNQKIDSLVDRIELRELQDKFPELKGLSSEFEEYRKDYPRHKGENIAKLFLAEKGLIETQRKGLEKTTGGPNKTPTSSQMTAEDIEKLRTTNFAQYRDMLKKGLIKI